MNIKGRCALVTAAIGVGSIAVLPLASASGSTATVAAVASKTTLVVRPTAPSSTKPVSLSSKVKPKVASTTAPLPTGTVCFYDGSATTSLACASLVKSPKGDAIVHVKVTLTAGSHVVTAKYSGNTTYAASQSNPVTFTVS